MMEKGGLGSQFLGFLQSSSYSHVRRREPFKHLEKGISNEEEA